MSLLKAIESGWSWRGLSAAEVLEVNAFGNVLLRDKTGGFWRICPEELKAERIANSAGELATFRAGPAFIEDWNMDALVQSAKVKLGSPEVGRCYCMKIPGVLGGEYRVENLATIAIEELILASGDMARQIADLPDGSKVKLTT
jgi:hypothetical protein